MFVAHIKKIEIGETIDKILFTEKKYQYINRVVVLEKSQTHENFYYIYGTNLLIHESWTNGVFKCEENATLIFIHHTNGQSIPVICSNDYLDIRTGKQINVEKIVSTDILIQHKDIVYNSPSYSKSDICSKCGEKFYIQSAFTDHICYDCYLKYKKRCSICNKFHIGEGHICAECEATKCKCVNCGKVEYNRQSIVFVEGNPFCISCYRLKTFPVCDMCNTPYLNTDKLHSYHENNICEVCKYEIVESRKGIQNYTYKPEPIFYGNSKDGLYMGVELEIETPMKRETIAKYIQTKINHNNEVIYCKHDASIGEDSSGRRGGAGFEIVTHPFSFDWINSEEGTSVLKNILSLSDYRCRSYHTNTCGMHIHMSKNAFLETDHLFNFISFVFNNKDFNILISERRDMEKVEKYCSFTPETTLRSLAESRTNTDGDGRHKAINLNCEDTVELRIFRGTLNYKKFMKNIEYCKSLFEYTKTNNVVMDYLVYVDNNKETYNFLYGFLRDKGVL